MKKIKRRLRKVKGQLSYVCMGIFMSSLIYGSMIITLMKKETENEVR